jgi:DNA-binding MarR family transcriptional regulator
MNPQESVTDSVAFLLGKLGQVATGRFADRLAPIGLRPRHCGVLELLGRAPMTQLDLARNLSVTPSVVVDMLDELEAVDAVRRVRDTRDRRRQLVELTPDGRTLTRRAARLARQTDVELLHPLDPTQTAALRDALEHLATTHAVTAPKPAR